VRGEPAIETRDKILIANRILIAKSGRRRRGFNVGRMHALIDPRGGGGRADSTLVECLISTPSLPGASRVPPRSNVGDAPASSRYRTASACPLRAATV